MATSIYNTILDAVVSAVTALGLVDASSAAPTVAKRKLPTTTETLDTLPVVLVVPSDRPPTVKPTGFENCFTVTYTADVVILFPNAGDQITNIDVITNWRQQMLTAFYPPKLSGASTVYDSEVNPDPVFDRSSIPDSYDVSVIRLTFQSAEAV